MTSRAADCVLLSGLVVDGSRLAADVVVVVVVMMMVVLMVVLMVMVFNRR